MTLGAIKALYIKHMGEYSNDADDPSVMAQYMPEALAYINEGYAVVMKRYNPETYFDPLTDDEDEPIFQPAAYHSILADYAAARCLSSEPGKMERSNYLMAQFQTGLYQVECPSYRFIHRWD